MESTDHHCPLCGKENRCTLAATAPVMQQKRVTPCWCHQRELPEALSEQIPAAQRMKACLCQCCIDTFKAQQPSQ